MRQSKTLYLLAGLGAWILIFADCSTQQSEEPEESAWKQHYQTGLSAMQQGRYTEAESSLQLALEEAKSFQEQDPRLHGTLDNLAQVCVVQGQNARAESLYIQIITIQKKHRGARHQSTVSTLGKLTDLYRNQSEFARAESLYKQIISIQEDHLQLRDQSIASTLGKLADLYRNQSEFARADSLSKRSMGLKFHAQGYAYFLQGRTRQAEMLYKRALAVQEKNLGKNHPDLARTCSDLALLYDGQKAFKTAETYYRRALAVQEKNLDKNHPDLARTLDHLAALLKKTARPEEAATMEARARAIRSQASPP